MHLLVLSSHSNLGSEAIHSAAASATAAPFMRPDANNSVMSHQNTYTSSMEFLVKNTQHAPDRNSSNNRRSVPSALDIRYISAIGEDFPQSSYGVATDDGNQQRLTEMLVVLHV